MAVGCHAQGIKVTAGTRRRHAAPKNKNHSQTQRRGRIAGQSHAAPVGIWSALATNRHTKGKGGKQRAYVDVAMANGTYGSK
jgi:hypothetical protein